MCDHKKILISLNFEENTCLSFHVFWESSDVDFTLKEYSVLLEDFISNSNLRDAISLNNNLNVDFTRMCEQRDHRDAHLKKTVKC